MRRLIDWFLGRPTPPKLRNKPQGMAWIRDLDDVPGAEVMNGRAVKTVRLKESGYWAIEPVQEWRATGSILVNGSLVRPGDLLTTSAICDACLEPWKDTGLRDEDVRALYEPGPTAARSRSSPCFRCSAATDREEDQPMHPAFAVPRDSLGAELPDSIVSSQPCAPCSRALTQRVGERLGRADLADAELDQHIADLTVLWMEAYKRFQAHGNPVDREDALLWLHTRDRAHLERSRGATEAQRLDEGVDFFQSRHALAMGRAGGAA
jgi:hypothetical protein